MSRISKRGDVRYYDGSYNGIPMRRSLDTKNRKEALTAKRYLDKRRREGKLGSRSSGFG